MKGVGGRCARFRRPSEEKALDVGLDEELGSGVGGEAEPQDGSTLLLAVGAAEATVSTVVLVSGSVLL